MIARGQTLGVGATPRRRRERIIYVYMMGGGGSFLIASWGHGQSPPPLYFCGALPKREGGRRLAAFTHLNNHIQYIA